MTEPEPNEPVSWLRLERYHLGELSAEEAAEVTRAIAADPATRECFELIQRPLSRSVLLNPRPEPTQHTAPRFLRALRSPAAMTLLAAAAALLIYVIARPSDHAEHVDGMPAPRVHTKGGDVAVELVRERVGVVTMRPTTFGDADHFKVVLTCPPSMTVPFDVLVFQGADVFRPLSPLGPVMCGNGVALPGAFTLTGSKPSTVCVVWGKAAAGGVSQQGRAVALQGTAVCTTVTPER